MSVICSTLLPQTLIADEQNNPNLANSYEIEIVEIKSRKLPYAESVQDIPMALQAFDNKALDELNFNNLSDLSYTVPNAQFESIGTIASVQSFSFRGQGINSSLPSIDPTVGVVIDGVALGTAYGVILDTFDLGSIEVFKGPQGVLFGRNVTGGVVNIRTARPKDNFEGIVKLAATAHNERTFAASLNSGKITDNIKTKLTYYVNDDKGYFDYLGSGRQRIEGTSDFRSVYFTDKDQHTGALRTKFIRSSTTYQPTASSDIVLLAESGTVKGDSASWQPVTSILDATNGVYLDDPQGEFEVRGDEAGLTDGKWNNVTVEANYHHNLGTFTNILGWRDLSILAVTDLDGSSEPIFSVTANTQQEQLSNELRYSGYGFEDKLAFTIGHYYFQQEIRYLEGRFISGGNVLLASGGEMDHKTQAIFLNSDWQISDKMTISTGIRFTKERKDVLLMDASNGPCRDVITFAACEYSPVKRSWSNTTAKLGFDYKFNSKTMLYGFWTQGFRSGGVNFRNVKPELISPGPTEAESNDVYEIGVKNNFLNNTLIVNAAAFINDVKDVQRVISISDPEVIVVQGTLNAGDTRIKGVELDTLLNINKSLSLMASVGLLAGKYTYKIPETEAFIGDDLPRLSKLSYSLNANYKYDFKSKGKAHFRLSYSYRDKAAYNDSNSAYFPAAKELGINLTWIAPSDKVSISLYGKNLFNEPRWGNLSGASFWAPMQPGRQIGVDFRYKFIN